MKLEQRSEAQFCRYTTRQTPRYRDPNFRILASEEIHQPTRRKHSAAVGCVQLEYGREVERAAHEYNETIFPFRQLTNSSTSVETDRIRSTTAPKVNSDTDVVVAQKSASRPSTATPTSSSIKQNCKQKLSLQFIPTHSETTSSLSLSTTTAPGPRKNKVKEGGSGPVPKPLLIFNVGKPSLLSGIVTLPASTSSTAATSRSTLTLDDIFLVDMDSFPSIPSPPDSPETKNSTTTTTSPNANSSYSASSASSDAPFSKPYDDDALLDNEIPFPLSKHNVTMENMGIKKAKYLSKRRESFETRYIPTTGADLCPRSTPPLALHSFSQNRPALPGITFPSTSSESRTSEISAGPSLSRTDAWGCTHLGAADCELSIAFPKTSHYEMWDLGDEAFFPCPVFLCLMAKDPSRWVGTPLSLPDVTLADIRCDDLPVPSPMSVYDPSVEFEIQCTIPSKNAWERGFLPPSSAVDHNEITTDGKWKLTYTEPKIEGPGQTRILRVANGQTNEIVGLGWYLTFRIPIPSRLFMKRETRIFEIKASVWMMGDEERVLSAMCEEDLSLLAEAEMTVSHLRRKREMD